MPLFNRRFTIVDHVITQLDSCLQIIAGDQPSKRPYPAEKIDEAPLSPEERKQSASFMRINHSGEVCAQALYNAQALVARDKAIQQTLLACAKEETDHLAWCSQRLSELDGHRSYLNGFWYGSSFLIGLTAGITGDKWSLGFVEETEIQVSKHLEGHLERMSLRDKKSRAIINQMNLDETQHAETAKQKGAAELPKPIKTLMRLQSKVMTTLAYWL